MKARLPALFAALIVGISACGGDDASAPAPSGGALDELQAGYNHVVDAVSPSVVQIETGRGVGSGVVYDGDGHIVTNAHVVGDATTFRITVASGKRVRGTLRGRWIPGDLAVVRAKGADLKPARFADSSKLEVGDIAIAVGNPLGLRSSVTQGIVSSLGRTVSEGNGVTIPAAIQTSAAINPGNSGGALADLDGRVIGIPTLAAIDPALGGSRRPASASRSRATR